MPIEIKELHVKINVDEDQRQRPDQNQEIDKKDALVAECVEQVMQIISNLKER